MKATSTSCCFEQWFEGEREWKEEELTVALQRLDGESRTVLDSTLLELRRELGHLESEAFLKARTATNPYENLGNAGFVCRSALKLANLEYVCQFCSGVERFADICAAPGGFSEFLLWKNSKTQGFALSLDGKNADGPGIEMQFHHPRLISYAGDIYLSSDVNRFVSRTTTAKIDLVVADGGFHACRDQPDQDIQLARLALCETEIALRILKYSGHFVLKLFLPLSSPPTLAIIAVAHACFRQIGLIKPITSRPASGELYLIGLYCHAPLHARQEAAKTFRTYIDNPSLFSISNNHSPKTQDTTLFDIALDRARSYFLARQIKACRKALSYAHSFDDDDDDYALVDNSSFLSPSSILALWNIQTMTIK